MGKGIPPIRCPQLGHQVEIAYCYRAGLDGLPCRRLFICWEAFVPRLRQVVARLLTEEEWKRCFEDPPKSKMQTLMELVERARETKGHGGDEEDGPAGQ
jgi:hypothetical protein